jgi:hypothetical protein
MDKNIDMLMNVVRDGLSILNTNQIESIKRFNKLSDVLEGMSNDIHTLAVNSKATTECHVEYEEQSPESLKRRLLVEPV